MAENDVNVPFSRSHISQRPFEIFQFCEKILVTNKFSGVLKQRNIQNLTPPYPLNIECIFLFGLGYHIWRGTRAGNEIYRCPIFNNITLILKLSGSFFHKSQNVIWVHKIDFTPKDHLFQCHTGQKWDSVQNGSKNDFDLLPKWVLYALSGQFAWVLSIVYQKGIHTFSL